MTLLSEWNNGALALIAALFLVPTIIIFFLFTWLIRSFPASRAFLQNQKNNHSARYIALLCLVLLLAFLLTLGVFYLVMQ